MPRKRTICNQYTEKFKQTFDEYVVLYGRVQSERRLKSQKSLLHCVASNNASPSCSSVFAQFLPFEIVKNHFSSPLNFSRYTESSKLNKKENSNNFDDISWKSKKHFTWKSWKLLQFVVLFCISPKFQSSVFCHECFVKYLRKIGGSPFFKISKAFLSRFLSQTPLPFSKF